MTKNKTDRQHPRRAFFKTASKAGVFASPLASSYLLTACGEAGLGSLTDTTSVGTKDLTDKMKASPATTAATVRIQARQVQWVTNVNPSKPNAWVYVQTGFTPNGVLSNHYGPTFNVRRDVAFTVTWANEIPPFGVGSKLLADPPMRVPLPNGMCGSVSLQSSVALVTHLHGSRAKANSDGSPVQPMGFVGNPYGFPSTLTYTYPNAQRAGMLWYHDHSLDSTGQNVYAGLVGLYFIRDTFDDRVLAPLGGTSHEIPLVIQDRVLTVDQLAIDYAATMADTGAAVRPEALGKQIFLNGHPTGDVTIVRSIWRLRLLNASNSRTYALALYDPVAMAAGTGRVWYSECLHLIGADGGLMSRSVSLAPTDFLVVAPSQRRDILLDLTLVDFTVKTLRLVNLSLASAVTSSDTIPEAIFTDVTNSVLIPTSADYSVNDQAVYAAMAHPLAQIADFQLIFPISSNYFIFPPQRADILASIETTLRDAATDIDFVWNGSVLGPKAGVRFGPNRLILPISNTEGFAPTAIGNGLQGWSDVQIFELQDGRIAPAVDNAAWQLPFAVDLVTAANPAPASPTSVQTAYTIARRSYFQTRSNPDITIANRYPTLHAPTINAKAGTYERWYVANIGNSQPLNANAGTPDMHPFHIHLVNFVVTRRWELDSALTGGFIPVAASDLNLDGIARQDTVLIASGQIVELLVYYPVGYTGDFMYHCHLLEHEDKCMMSTFRVA
jgi:FtsP/CotA-like multicopper oxidase with cupredoxin domain